MTCRRARSVQALSVGVADDVALRFRAWDRGVLDRPGRGEAAKIQLNSLATDADKTYAFQRGWGVMSKFERLLEAGSTELPDCRCTAEMNLMAIVPRAEGDTEIRIFRCPHCSHELRLTAWRNVVPATT
jgi:hypothetical protein